MHFTKGTLKVIMTREGHSDEVIWQRDGDQGNGWHRANISLVSDGPYRLVLQGSRGSTSTETGIALDDIRFSETSCLPIALDCGRRGTDRSKRILGGKLSAQGEWPWMVFVRTEIPGSGGLHVYRCGASLISSRWVLTASHCFEHEDNWITDPSAITLVFGEQNLNKWNDPQFSIRPEKLIIHPQRKKSSIGQVAPYDIALIKLPHAIHASEHVNVICLPPAEQELPLGTDCYVGGWGITDSGQDSEDLMHVDMKIIRLQQCFGYFGMKITKDLICATHASVAKSTCRGDSGGPLVCRDGDHFVQAGVVSWGVPCHLRDRPVPSVFARVSFFLPWIETTINENS